MAAASSDREADSEYAEASVAVLFKGSWSSDKATSGRVGCLRKPGFLSGATDPEREYEGRVVCVVVRDTLTRGSLSPSVSPTEGKMGRVGFLSIAPGVG